MAQNTKKWRFGGSFPRSDATRLSSNPTAILAVEWRFMWWSTATYPSSQTGMRGVPVCGLPAQVAPLRRNRRLALVCPWRDVAVDRHMNRHLTAKMAAGFELKRVASERGKEPPNRHFLVFWAI